MFVEGFRCVNCGELFPLNPEFFVCPKCGVERVYGVTVFKGITEVAYDYAAIGSVVGRDLFSKRVFNALRYRELLGFEGDANLITLCEGGTPLVRGSRIAEHLKIKHLLLKNEAQNPTGSFKDRESLMAINMALKFGFKGVSCVSSGNAASSLAAYAARAGLDCYVFMPSKASKGKVLQCLVYGAKTLLVDGIYEEIFEAHLEAIKGLNVLNATPGYNRFRVEGDKTIAYEICEQLDWRVPDWVIDNVGNGTHLYGMWKGFKELYQLGFINKLPKMIATGPVSGAPIVHCFKSGLISPLKSCGESIAEGLIGVWGYDAPLAIKALRESNGYAEYVSDDEILEAMKMLAKFEGIFAEPSAVASIAAISKLLESGIIDRKDEVVCLVTGSGLKDPEGGSRIAGNPLHIQLNVESIRGALQSK